MFQIRSKGLYEDSRGQIALNTFAIACFSLQYKKLFLFVLFDLILYVPSSIFQLCRDRSSWVEQVLS